MEAPDPLVIVIHTPREHTRGLDTGEEKDVPAHRAVPLSDALTTRYDTYAHFALYTLEGETKWPRINKPALPHLRAQGVKLTVSVTVIEWDTDDHSEQDVDDYNTTVNEIVCAAHELGLPEPTCIYKTRAGCRCLWQHPPIEPELAEGFARWLIVQFLKKGICFDATGWQWNRLYALPYVTRDGVPLEPPDLRVRAPLTVLPEFDDVGYRLTLTLDHAQLRAPLPDQSDAIALVWRSVSDRLTPWGMRAAKRMTNRDAHQVFDYSNPPDLPKGKRNDTLMEWIGSLTTMLSSSEGTTPEHIWGAVLPTAIHNTRPDGRNLTAECWKMVCYCWAREGAQTVAAAEETRTFLETLREGVKAWWPEPPTDDTEFSQALRRRLILSHDTSYYVLQQNGLYAPAPVKGPSIIPALRHSGLVGADRLIPALEVAGPKGPQRLTGQTALESMGCPVSIVELTGGPPEGGYLKPDGTLTISRYTRRTDIPAVFDQRVDDWWDAAYGPHKDTVYLWVKAALSFELGPVAALSIQGVSGMGKDMFGLSLAETITSRTCAGSELFEGWQYFIDRTPFVWINEQNPPGAKGYDGRFRELVGGTYLTINQKYQAMVRVLASLRMLMTANSDLLVKKLYARRGMQRDEREATDLRLIHLDLRGREEGAKYLRQKGGLKYTKGWVRRGNEAGDSIVASHMLWAYENITLPEPGRFLLDGKIVPEHAFENEDIADLGEILVAMFEKNLARNGHLSASEILDYMDNQSLTPPRKGFNLVSLGRCLDVFAKGSKKKDGRVRLDTSKLLSFARHVGLSHKKLQATQEVVA